MNKEHILNEIERNEKRISFIKKIVTEGEQIAFDWMCSNVNVGEGFEALYLYKDNIYLVENPYMQPIEHRKMSFDSLIDEDKIAYNAIIRKRKIDELL